MTDDLHAAIVAALLTAHTTTHTSGNVAAKVKSVKRPIIAAAGTSEEWTYFNLRWKDYATATKLQG